MSPREPRVPVGAIHGRFQPFHLGHMGYLLAALELADFVFVGVTSPSAPALAVHEPSDPARHLPQSNPFSYRDRESMILRSVAAEDPGLVPRIRVVAFDVNADPATFPDAIPLDAVQYLALNDPWDAVKRDKFLAAGYTVRLLPTAVRRLTATSVRELMRAGDSNWQALVPDGTAFVISEHHSYRSRARSPLSPIQEEQVET